MKATSTTFATTPSTTGRGSRRHGDPRDHVVAQDALGEIVHFEPPEEWSPLLPGERATARSRPTKAASEVIAPLSGEVVEVNGKVVAEPETINEAPHADGWLVRIRLTDSSEVDELLDAAAYRELLADQ